LELARMGIFLLVGYIVLAISTIAAYGRQTGAEPPDVFAHENVRLEAGQVIERLLVASANADVSGIVKEGVVVVDGNLRLAPAARVNESVIVLGGYIQREAGAQVDGYLLNIPPQSTPILKILIGVLFLLAMLSLIILPVLLWLLLYMSQRIAAYHRLKNWLFTMQRRWPVLYVVLTLAFSCSMLVLFAQLAWQTIFRHTMGLFDNTFIWLVRYFASPALDHTMIFISNLGFGLAYGVIVAAVFSTLVIRHRWLELKGVVLCLAGGVVLNYVLKNLFERARPETFHLVAASGYSFPSGHAMVSLCFYGMLAFITARQIRSWQPRYLLGVITMLLIIAIGVSRIYLGVHYPSDVIAGYTAGAMWLMFNISLLMWWEQKKPGNFG
jgi:membrane-associated phospholipid phosphatase